MDAERRRTSGASRLAQGSGKSSRSAAARWRRACSGRPARTRGCFASYVWNVEGTEATLAPAEGLARVAEVAPNKFHNIPAVDQCRACHVSNRTELLGFNALQLSTDRDANALHAEPLEAGMITLGTLVGENLLAPARPELAANPPRIAARTADERALLGYLAGNCGGCHNRQSDLAPLGPPLEAQRHGHSRRGRARGSDRAPDQVAGARRAGRRERRDRSAQPEQSALLRRMRSRSPASQMPPMGTAVQDRDAVALVGRWLESQRPSAASRCTSDEERRHDSRRFPRISPGGCVNRRPPLVPPTPGPGCRRRPAGEGGCAGCGGSGVS